MRSGIRTLILDHTRPFIPQIQPLFPGSVIIDSLWRFLQIYGAIGPPIPPQLQTRIASDKMEYSYDGEKAVVKHIWDNLWLDIFFGLIVLFFASMFFVYGTVIAIGAVAFIFVMMIFGTILSIVAYLAYRKSKE